MRLRADVIAGLILFVLFAAYGLQALTIPLFPGQEFEPFKPRTMPVALAIIGVVLTAIHIVQALRAGPRDTNLGVLHWRPVAALCGFMIAYGFAMVPLGFVVATTLFLTAGFALLGERRLLVLALTPFGFSLAFYLLMTRVLDLYLAPGFWLAT